MTVPSAEHALAVANDGAELARAAGAAADPVALEDSGDVATSLLELADRHDAAAIVVGRRGVGGARAWLMGSTSRRLLHDARRPVLVVRRA